MTWHLRNDGHLVNEKRIRRLMRLMGLMPIYQKPNTSLKDKQHQIYPYLLKNQEINTPNQVWCSDITYLRMKGGLMYLVVVITGIVDMSGAGSSQTAWRHGFAPRLSTRL